MLTIKITPQLENAINFIEHPWFIINEDYIVGVYETRDQARRAKVEEQLAGKIMNSENVTLEVVDLSKTDELPDETITEEDEEELATRIDDEETIVLTKKEIAAADIRILAGIGNVMNTQVCPKCGSEELYTGRSDKGLLVDDEYIIGCRHCDWEVDTRKTTNVSKYGSHPREAMKTSLKLDRTITCVETGGTWKNAFSMWKTNKDWMTSSQQDRLTAVLYKAAKQGDQEVVEINGRHFQLVNVS